MQGGVVQHVSMCPFPVIPQPFPVIADDDNQRLLVERSAFQVIDQSLQLLVDKRQFSIVRLVAKAISEVLFVCDVGEMGIVQVDPAEKSSEVMPRKRADVAINVSATI